MYYAYMYTLSYTKSAHHKMYVLLSLCFSLCMSHGHIPQSLIRTTIVPIIKNKAGNLSSGNNYRPIALATVISKVFESLILLRCEQFFDCSRYVIWF